MNADLLNALILAACFLALFGLAEILYHFLKVKVELTRKIVHFGTGLLTMLFPVLLSNHWWVLVLCTSFAVILIFSLKFKLLPSINAIERESVGSIAYPISVYACFLAYSYSEQLSYFYLPILTLAFCDPVAALFGKRWPYGEYKIGKGKKTLMGTTLFFISALLLYYVIFFTMVNDVFSLKILLESIILAVFAAFIEAISGRGYDNLTIPAAVLTCLILFA